MSRAARTSLAADPRARGAAALLAIIVAAAVLGPVLYPTSPTALDTLAAGAPPSSTHPLGTDESGRDLLARLLHGARVTLLVALASVALAVALGVAVGATAGLRRGRVDAVLMRLTDAGLAVPTLFVVITAVTFIGPTAITLIVSIALTSWMTVARVIRGELLVIRELGFVESAHALGATPWTLFRAHIWPHLVPTLLTAATMGVSTAILMESALSYVGLGVQPPAASWGAMLSSAQSYLYAYPWLAAYPGALIVLTVMAINLLGDALRDAQHAQLHAPNR